MWREGKENIIILVYGRCRKPAERIENCKKNTE